MAMNPIVWIYEIPFIFSSIIIYIIIIILKNIIYGKWIKISFVRRIVIDIPLFVCILIILNISLMPSLYEWDSRVEQTQVFYYLVKLQECQRKYFQNNRRFASKFDELEICNLTKNNRYNYYLSKDIIQNVPIKLPDYLYPVISEIDYEIIAVSNIDTDHCLDIWVARPGDIIHLADDVKNVFLPSIEIDNKNNNIEKAVCPKSKE